LKDPAAYLSRNPISKTRQDKAKSKAAKSVGRPFRESDGKPLVLSCMKKLEIRRRIEHGPLVEKEMAS
jgi:hypothetical protein